MNLRCWFDIFISDQIVQSKIAINFFNKSVYSFILTYLHILTDIILIICEGGINIPNLQMRKVSQTFCSFPQVTQLIKSQIWI